jgi:hypothetical protein
MGFLQDIAQIDNQVKSGELDMAGTLALPKSGEAILFAVDIEYRDSRNWINFFFTLPGEDNFKKFDIRCPLSTDADNAKYMGMQNIYKTLFGVVKLDPKTISVDKAYSSVIDVLKNKSIKCQYELEERKYLAQRGTRAGQELTAFSLRSITGLSMITKINIEIKKKEPEQGGWQQNVGGEDVPF